MPPSDLGTVSVVSQPCHHRHDDGSRPSEREGAIDSLPRPQQAPARGHDDVPVAKRRTPEPNAMIKPSILLLILEPERKQSA